MGRLIPGSLAHNQVAAALLSCQGLTPASSLHPAIAHTITTLSDVTLQWIRQPQGKVDTLTGTSGTAGTIAVALGAAAATVPIVVSCAAGSAVAVRLVGGGAAEIFVHPSVKPTPGAQQTS